MRDQWYGDNRDLVKWAVLHEIARRYMVTDILQVLYYSPTDWARVEIDGKQVSLSAVLLKHFRDVDSISRWECGLTIEIFKEFFTNGVEQRKKYHEAVVRAIRAWKQKPSIVFLDPDTGLEPESGNFNSTHVTKTEIQSIWKALRDGDVLVFYQHQDNRRGEEWIVRKKTQLANALEVDEALVTRAHAPQIANDVAFYFVQKPEF